MSMKKCQSVKYSIFFRIELERVEDIEQGVFDLTVLDKSTGQPIKPGEQVSVGRPIEISAAPVAAQQSAIADFFLADCTATNGQVAIWNKKSLLLIKDGCMTDLKDLEISIKSASPNPGHEISYNQFGFVDRNSGLSFEII